MQIESTARSDAKIGARPENFVDFASAGPKTAGGKFLRRFWQPVYVSANLARGSAKPILIMGERFTLYRGQSGRAYIVGNRCAHRCTQLSTGWVKEDAIRCLYHGWTYDGSGKCIERPAESPPGPRPDISIGAYPTKEHLGLVYGYFGAGEEPPFPPFPSFEGEGIVENITEEFPCNWFQTYENHADEVHLAFVHSSGGSHDDLKRTLELPKMSGHETEYGMVRVTSITGGPERSTLLIFPNTMRLFLPPLRGLNKAEIGGWRDTYVTIVPTDDEDHILFATRFVQVPPDQLGEYWTVREQLRSDTENARSMRDVTNDILAGKLTLAEAKGHPRFLMIEDAVAQLGQGAIVDRSSEMLGSSDVLIAIMRRLFTRELRAIADGGAVKNWRYGGEPPMRGL